MIQSMKDSILNRQFRYSYSNMSLVLVCINIFTFFLTEFAFPRLKVMLSMSPLYVMVNHSYWTFFTYMFVHGSIAHLFSNMLGLYIFGSIVERNVGSKEFLLYYFLCGTLSGIASYISYRLTGNYFVFLMGASGALYAVILLYAVMFPDSTVMLFGLIPLQAWVLALGYFVLEFFGTFVSDGIAHATHLFGLVFGLIYIMVRFRINPVKRLFNRI